MLYRLSSTMHMCAFRFQFGAYQIVQAVACIFYRLSIATHACAYAYACCIVSSSFKRTAIVGGRLCLTDSAPARAVSFVHEGPLRRFNLTAVYKALRIATVEGPLRRFRASRPTPGTTLHKVRPCGIVRAGRPLAAVRT